MPRRLVLGCWLIVFAVVYGSFYAFGDSVRFAYDASPPCWPAIGIYLAFMVGMPRRAWPALALIALAIAVRFDHQLSWKEIVPWLANSTAVTVGAWCMRRIHRNIFTPLDSTRVAGILVVSGAVVPLISAGLIKSLAALVHLQPHMQDNIYSFFTADSLGVLTIVPFLVAVSEIDKWGAVLRDKRGLVADGLILAANLIVALAVFYGFGLPPLLTRTFLLSPFLVLVAFRGRRGLSAVAILAVSLIGMTATFSGHGPIFTQSETPRFITAQIQIFLVMITLMIVFLTEAVRARTTLTRQLNSSNAALQAEIAARRAAEEHLELAIDATELGVWESRPQTGELVWSERVWQILGLPPEAPASTESFLASVTDGDEPRLAALVEANRMAATGATFSDDFCLRRPGPAHWIRVRGKAYLQDPARSDGPTRIAGTIRDITDEVRAREALQAANAQAVAANQAKSQFLANMSHEIRSPLTAMLGFADLLLDSATRPAEYRPFAELIKRNGQHLSELINQILDLSKVESGHLELSLKPFALLELLEDVVALMQVKAAGKGLQLILEVARHVPLVLISDALRLRQILLNALSNAIKFTDRGQVQLSVDAAQLHSGAWRLQIDIADSGVGLSAAEQAHLFQPFTQGNAEVASVHGGTGLGLALSRRLARLLGGDFIIHSSKKGVGTVFRLTLLAATAQESSALRDRNLVTTAAEARTLLAGKQILLADDFADSRALVSRYLEIAGAHVDCVVNGDEAVKQALRGSYDVVILDLQMPEVDGMEAARLLREAAFERPLIALTGRTMAQEVKAALAIGFDAHVGKPINRDVLLSTVQAACGRQQQPLH